MAHTQYYAVQPFMRVGRGQLKAGELRQCSSPEAAARLAERLVSERKAAGALAYSRPGAISADEYAEPMYLARIGDVPETDAY